MSQTAEQLTRITEKASRLIELCSALQEENDLLRQENEALKDAFEGSENKTKELEERLKALKLARSLEGMELTKGEANEKALDIKQKISEFVREIDKCIVLLKK
jgi:ribosomal protein L4